MCRCSRCMSGPRYGRQATGVGHGDPTLQGGDRYRGDGGVKTANWLPGEWRRYNCTTWARLLLVLPLLTFACAHRMPQDRRGSGLVIETEAWDFGTLERGETRTGHIALANQGSDTLRVYFHSTCDCLAASPSEAALAPGTEATIRLTYMGDEIKAPVTKTVFIDSNDPDNARFAFTVTGNVIPGSLPHLVGIPDPLPLDPSDPSYPVANLTLTNRGRETLRIEDITCFGCISARSRMELVQGEEAVLEITPLPDWTERRWIEIESNDPVQPLKRIAIVEFD
jgi:hypothetical protein